MALSDKWQITPVNMVNANRLLINVDENWYIISYSKLSKNLAKYVQ